MAAASSNCSFLTLARCRLPICCRLLHKKFQKNRKTICIYQKKRLFAQIAHIWARDEVEAIVHRRKRYSTIGRHIRYLTSIISRHIEANKRTVLFWKRSFKKVNNWILRIYLLSLVHCFRISLFDMQIHNDENLNLIEKSILIYLQQLCFFCCLENKVQAWPALMRIPR